jgi:alpha-glucosidase
MNHSTWVRTERGIEMPLGEGRMEVAFVTPSIVRVRYSAKDEFAPRRSWSPVKEDKTFGTPDVTLTNREGALMLDSGGGVRVKIDTKHGKVGFSDPDGQTFAADTAPIEWGEVLFPFYHFGQEEEGAHLPDHAKIEATLTKRMAKDEVYLGFGERIGQLDRRARRLTNWTADPAWGHGRGHDNLYQAQPVFMAQRPGLAWGLYLNCTWFSQFDVGSGEANRLSMITHGGELEYYLIYGPTPAQVVDGLTQLTGRPALPPLWSLGYHQSRWSYMDEAEFRMLAREFRERQIPIDVLHFDIDYMRGYRDFTWDPERFPAPKELITELREQGIRAVTIVDPGVKYDMGNNYRVADEGVMHSHFVKAADGTLFSGYCWPDAALFPDFTKAETRKWWGEQHPALTIMGVAGIWNDMNEPAIFERPFSEGSSPQKPMPLGTPHGDANERTVHAEVHNLYGYLMGKATYEGLRRIRPDERPWVLTRSAFVGSQVYCAAWMGDNNSWWEHLEASLPQLMSMGLSGATNVGVDIGGFFDNATEELYMRWVEVGTFYPFMRTHTSMGSRRQEPWSFGEEVETVARQAIELRYRLLPYFYTLAHDAHRTGAPMFRPLSYDFPDDTETYHLHTQVMVGPHLMIAPIVTPGMNYRMVYLPDGIWYDFHTGQKVEGKHHRVVHATPGRMPIFVRGGAVLPMGNLRQSTNEPLTELTLNIYPGATASDLTLIEDDGISFAYQRGGVAETTVLVDPLPGKTRVTVLERVGAYQPPARSIRLVIHGGEAPQEFVWQDEGNEQVVEY